jgi:hypothetical protein
MPRRVRCIPSSDEAFGDAARAALLDLDGVSDPAQIELLMCGLLIDRYPRVDVHRQEELGRSFDEEVWYAYRDGRPAHGTSEDPN